MGEAFNREVDVVKDIKDKKGLQDSISGNNTLDNIGNVDSINFEEFDNKIEQSFQEFLKSMDSHSGDIKENFNTWLDRQTTLLDTIEFEEIEKRVIGPIQFELNKEATIVGLENIQQSLGNNKLQNLKLFSKEIDTDHLAGLFNLKFDGRTHLLELLNSAKKQNGDESVKKFQRIIIGLDETDATHDQDGTTHQKLGPKGVDGNFGINTVKAFEKYISDKLEKGKVSLNAGTKSLGDGNLDDVKKYVEQHEGQQTLDLKNIQTITPNIARELAQFKGTIDLTGLTSITSDILVSFLNNISGNTVVNFPKGTLKGNNKEVITIDGKDYKTDLNNLNTICSMLTSSTTNQGQTNGNPGSSSSGSNGQGTGTNPNGAPVSANNGNDQYTQALHEGFNYAKSVNEAELKEELPDNEKEAIKLLTVGTKAYWVARIFRARGYNNNVSIVDKDYDPMRNKPERLALKSLREGLESCLDKGGNLDRELLTKALLSGDNKDKDVSELNKLYKNFKAGKFDNLPYLQRVMELIDDCFIQGGMVDSNGNAIDTFEELYKDILIGSNYDLLNHKEKNIDESLLTEIKNQLNELEQDIIGDEDKNKLTDEYKGMVVAMSNINKLLNIGAGNFQSVMDKYKFGNKESVFKSLEQVKFACCLCDLNTDGKIDVADKDTKTGQELFNLIVDAQIEGQDAMDNILKYAEGYAKQCGHENTLKKLQELSKMENASEKIAYIAKNPILMQYLREMLTKSSIDNVSSIVLKGSAETLEVSKEEQKFWEYMMDPNVTKTIDERFDEALAKIKEDLKNNKELSEDQIKEIIKNLEENPEELKRTLRTAFSGYLALGHQTGSIGAGATILNFGQIFTEALQTNFSLGVHGGLNGNGALFGLSLSGGAAWKVSERWRLTLGGVAGGGYAFGADGSRGLSAAIVPGALYQINNKNLTNTLDVRSAKYIGASLIGMYGTAGFGVGGALQYKRDMLEGIEQTSKNMSVKLLDSLINAYNSNRNNFLDKKTFTDIISKQLKNDFPNTDDDTINNYTLLLYTGISYYVQKDNGEAPTPGEMGKIFSNVSKDFTLNWKNTAVASLNGDVDLTGVSAGVVWLGGDAFAPAGGIQITNYENLFAHDTQESRQRYESSLYSELGMELHGKIDNEGITQETVDYLNKKLSIFFPRGDVPDITLAAEMEPRLLCIPKELCKYVDIFYSSELQNHIKQTSNDTVQVPANMRIGLSTYIGGGTMRATLILGNNKKSASDKSLTIDSTFDKNNDPTTYTPDTERISLDNINKINAGLREFMVTNKDFPLRSCERANGEQILFNVASGQEVSVDQRSGLYMQDGKILLPSNSSGELKVVRGIDNKCVVSFDANNSKTLSIKYNKVKKFEGNFDFQDKTLDGLLDRIELGLSKKDGYKNPLYNDFMDKAYKADYNESFQTLLKLLNLSGDEYKDFIDYLNKIEDKDKILVVDRFKAIFSYNPNLSKPSVLKDTLNRRKEQYKNLFGYDKKTVFPLKDSNIDYRAEIMNELTGMNSIPRVEHHNLIGMTAFYRGDNYDAKSYMLTQLGGTNVLGGITKEIEQGKLEATQNWLINNLKYNQKYEEKLLKSIAEKLEIDINNVMINEKRTRDILHTKLSGLLRGKSVDIGGKNVTIKAKYVFYLLGECANESIGVEIEDVEEGSYSDSVTVNYDISGSAAGLYVRTQASESQMGISANQHNITIFDVFGSGPTPEVEEPKPNAGSNPNGGLSGSGSNPNGGIPGSGSNPDGGIHLGRGLDPTPPTSRRESLNN